MKTREEIYSGEASSLLRDVTTYHCIKGKQLAKLYRGKEQKIDNLLRHLVKQGRVFYDIVSDTYYDSREMKNDMEMLTALWVLADFGDKTEFHSTDIFPVKIIFFANGEIYEIIYVAKDKESIILHTLSNRKDGENGKQILIVEDQKQIADIDIPDSIFCTVFEDGTVQYYRKE